MTYADGTQIRLGDTVEARGGLTGVVVCVIGEQYSQDFSEADWAYLNSGILIRTEDAGLVHLSDAPTGLKFVAR